VLLDDSVNHGKAKTGSFIFALGGEEWFEDPGGSLPFHAAAVIFNLETDKASGSGIGEEKGTVLIKIDGGGGDGDQALVFDGVSAVYHHIHDNLFQHPRISLDHVKVRLQVGFELDVLANQPVQHFFHIHDELIKPKDTGVNLFAAAEGEELAGKVTGQGAETKDE